MGFFQDRPIFDGIFYGPLLTDCSSTRRPSTAALLGHSSQGTSFPRLRRVALRRRWTDSEYCRKKKGRILDPALVTYAPHLI